MNEQIDTRQRPANPYALMTTTPYGAALTEVARDLEVVFQGDTPALQQYMGALYLHFRRTPQLQRTTPESIKMSVLAMALSGLDIRNPGEAWLIPYNNALVDDRGNKTGERELQCTLLTGYVGRRKQALSHDAVLDAWAESVRVNDTFVYHGKAAMPEHTFNPFLPRGNLVGFYAIVELEGKRYRCEVMSLEDVRAHRDQYSRSAKSLFWAEELNGKENRSFEQMALKTILSRVCNPRVIPMTDHVRRQIESEEDTMRNVTPQPTPMYLPPEEATPPTEEEFAQTRSELWGDEMASGDNIAPGYAAHLAEQADRHATDALSEDNAFLFDFTLEPKDAAWKAAMCDAVGPAAERRRQLILHVATTIPLEDLKTADSLAQVDWIATMDLFEALCVYARSAAFAAFSMEKLRLDALRKCRRDWERAQAIPAAPQGESSSE